LLTEAQFGMDRGEHSLLQRQFEHFNRRRQAVSHIANDPSRPTYLETIETIKDWGDLRMTVQGMTQFVCQEVSKRLAEPPIPPSLLRDPWSYLLPQIRTEW